MSVRYTLERSTRTRGCGGGGRDGGGGGVR